jgi:hypothetical protein
MRHSLYYYFFPKAVSCFLDDAPTARNGKAIDDTNPATRCPAVIYGKPKRANTEAEDRDEIMAVIRAPATDGST